MAEETLIAGPTHATTSIESEVEKAFTKSQDGALPVLMIYTFKNFYNFEGLALNGEYSSQPQKNGFAIVEGLTVFICGVEKVHSNKIGKAFWVIHLLNV